MVVHTLISIHLNVYRMDVLLARPAHVAISELAVEVGMSYRLSFNCCFQLRKRYLDHYLLHTILALAPERNTDKEMAIGYNARILDILCMQIT